jgi:putative FmdB family regulatory protein
MLYYSTLPELNSMTYQEYYDSHEESIGMPTYEYECTKCEHLFELQQRITEPPRKRCPKCRGKVMRIISGGGGVILKGSGFYVTDYRTEAYKKSAQADKDPGAAGASPAKDTKKEKTEKKAAA